MSEADPKSQTPINPTPFLISLHKKRIIVKLKWGMEYHGTLKRADTYMNLSLRDVDEYVDNKLQSHIDSLLIRCNNILYIGEIKDDDDDEEEEKEDDGESKD